MFSQVGYIEPQKFKNLFDNILSLPLHRILWKLYRIVYSVYSTTPYSVYSTTPYKMAGHE